MAAVTTVPPPPPPPPAPPRRAAGAWWALAAGVALMAVVVVLVVVLTGGDAPPGTTAAASTTEAPTTSGPSSTTTLAPTTTAPTTTEPPTTQATTTSTTSTTTIPDTGFGQAALDYFAEIAGGAEYGGGSATLHRWSGDIRISIAGAPTPADRRALDRVVEDLNALIDTVEVRLVQSDPNLEVHFAPVDDFPSIEPNYVAGNLGFVYIYWDDAGQIYSGRVLISTTELTQAERSHLIREEITQSLGLLNDSLAYPESIFYQDWTDVRSYAPIDRRVIRMLYLPEITAGMTLEEALQILASS